jgi:hypothetical protein
MPINRISDQFKGPRTVGSVPFSVAVFSSHARFKCYSKFDEFVFHHFDDTGRSVDAITDLIGRGCVGVVFDGQFNESQENLLVWLLVSHVPVALGPNAGKSPLALKLKPGIDAAGGILEIVSSERGFRSRLNRVLTTAFLRSASAAAVAGQWHSSDCRDYYSFAVGPWGSPIAAGTGHGRWLKVGSRSVPKGDLSSLKGVADATLDLRCGETGRLDAGKVGELFGLSRAQMALQLGVSAEALRQTPDSQRHQLILLHFERVAALRSVLSKPDDFPKWLQMPNSELGGRSPMSLIVGREVAIVADLVSDILTNQGR